MTDEFDLDLVLSDIGKFGKYQIIIFALLSLPIFLTGSFTLSYVFTTGNLDYRCRIPECDEQFDVYNTTWFTNAIPHKNSMYSKCSHYGLNEKFSEDNNKCTRKQMFNTSIEIKCDKFIYKDDEVTILNEFNLNCQQNEWKLALVGTLNNVALFFAMPITGWLSDRYGRKNLLFIGLICSGTFGTMRSLAQNYWTFIVFEILDAALGSATYTTAFVLGMEILCPKRRVLGATIIAHAFAFGEAFLGLMAMYTRHFRILLRIIYIPAFLFITCFWFIPESLRWLIIRNRYDNVKQIILKMAKTNNIKIADNLMDLLNDKISNQNGRTNLTTISTITLTTSDVTPEVSLNQIDNNLKTSEDGQFVFRMLYKNPFLLLRVVNCSLTWITITFVYYGLSLNSVSLAGDKYLNFILISLAEIPGFILCNLILDRFGRRLPLFSAFVISGVACILSEYLSTIEAIRLVMFLIGKVAITFSFTCVYIYTTELFPTNVRLTLVSTCSMIGRIGSMLAPMTLLLITYMKSLPTILFASSAIMAAILTLQFPETVNTKLPDTIVDARNLGKTK